MFRFSSYFFDGIELQLSVNTYISTTNTIDKFALNILHRVNTLYSFPPLAHRIVKYLLKGSITSLHLIYKDVWRDLETHL